MCHVLFSPMLTFWTFRFEGTESNGLEYGDKPGGFVKSPGSVVVVRSKAINYLHLVAVVLRDADND